MPNSDLTNRIRAIFLHEKPTVSTETAAALLGWSRDELTRAVETSEVEAKYSCSKRVGEIEEIGCKVLEKWPLDAIEEALGGGGAALVLPPELRTQSFSVRLPRYQRAMLRVLAQQRQTTAGHLIARQLEYLADEHMHEMSAAIPGFSDAFHWPHVVEETKPC